MATCYLFADKFDDENCLSIRLDDNGDVVDTLAIRSLDEFRILQKNTNTVVVISAQLVAIHTVQIPLLNESKARPAISYALEENLAESVSQLHFAFDKSHYIAGKYLVIVIEKSLIVEIQAKLDKFQIEYNKITCDWFALNIGEACVVANRYMVNDISFQGALDLDLFQIYLKEQTNFSHIYMFNDSPALPHSDKFTKVNLDTYVWIAKKLNQQKSINLCQAEFAHNTNAEVSKKYLKCAGVLGAIWVFWLLLSKTVSLILINHQLAIYNEKIAVVYRKFFPDAKQVISPKFRISQILQKNKVGQNSIFWQLLAKFSTVIKDISNYNSDNTPPVSIEQISMQNNNLSINVTCRDFDILEKIEIGLKSQQIKLHKSGVTTKNNKVIATLELQ